jgi:glycosyltransferase involved in cell wall biosynthesis
LLNPEQPEVSNFLQSLNPSKTVVRQEKKKLAILCPPGRDAQVDLLVPFFSERLVATKTVSLKPSPYFAAISASDIVWLEGVEDLTVSLSREKDLFKGRRVLVRLSSQEVLSHSAEKLFFGLVSDIVFESFFCRDYFLNRKLPLNQGTGLHVIPRPINLKNYPLKKTEKKEKLVFTGPLDFYQDPLLALSAFAFLKKRHNDFKLSLGGIVNESALKISLPHFVKTNALEQSVFFQGNVTDWPSFLAGADVILSTSLLSEPEALPEALAMGLFPLLRSCPGLEEFLPKSFLWRDFDELIELLEKPHSPEEGRNLVLERHEPEKVVQRWLTILDGANKG